MDATPTPLSHKVFILLTAALLAAVPAFAAGNLNVNGATSAAVFLTAASTSATVSVTSTGDPISFTTSITQEDCSSSNWLSAAASGPAPASGAGSATVYLQMLSIPSLLFCGSGPFTATVTLSDTVTLTDTATISVTFTPGTGGGPSAPLTVSPATLALQLNAAGSVQGTLTVRSSDPTSISFTASASTSMGGWSLGVGQVSGSVSASSPFTLTVTASTAMALSSTFTGTVTISPLGYSQIPVDVTLTVNGPSGANTDLMLAYGSTTASNVSLIAAYNTGDALPKTIASLAVQSASNQGVYQVVSVTYESGEGWLMVGGFDGSTPQSYGMANPLALDLGSAVTALADGVHQATVNLGEPPASGGVTPIIATVLVTLYKNTATPPVSANPASWALQVALNGNPQSQTFTITSGPGTTLGTITGDASWIQVGTLAADGSLPVTADPTGLTANTYSGNLVVPSNVGSPLLVPIVMVVSSSGAGTGAQVVAPSALSLAYQINGPALLPPTVVIPGTLDQNFFATVDQTWMILDPPSAPLPASTLVHINPAGLAAQTAPYSGHININTDNGLAVIPVKLLVTTSPVIFSSPGSLVFTQTGSGFPSQKVDFSATDGSALTITPSAPNTPWVHFTMAPNPFTNGQTLTVSVDATGMPTGTFGGAIQVAASGFVNSPMTFPVTLVTGGGGNGQSGALTVSSSALKFNAVVGGSTSTQTLTVDSNTGATSFTAASQMLTGSGWLFISPSGSLTTKQDITVTVTPAGNPAGTYSGVIQLTVNGATQQVQVSLVISSSLTGGNVNVAPSNLSLAYTIGGTAPSAQLQVSNVVSGSAQIPFTVSALNSPAWLTVTPPSANTPATISVGVNPSGLTAGPFNGTIRITPTGGQPVDVPVLLTVAAPFISVDAASLTFTYHAGDPKPASQTVHVAGGANVSFTAQAASAGGWLSVTPASGVANPATLTVSVDPTGLTPASYAGTIAVAGANGASGSATIAVTLNVLAPFPTISGVSNAASGYSGSLAPGELISIYGTQLGPATPVPTQLDSTGNFVATTLGGVQVFVSGYAAPVLYASNIQVNAVVPYEVQALKLVYVEVKYLNQPSNIVTLPLTATAPGVFTLNASGSGQGLILNAADYSVNGPAKPATKGSYVLVYVTGEGQTLPNGITGKVIVAQAASPYTPTPQLTVVPRVDGQVAYFNFAGEAPGFVSGVMQVNVQIPANARSGDLPIDVSVGGNDSQTGVTVRVQ